MISLAVFEEESISDSIENVAKGPVDRHNLHDLHNLQILREESQPDV